MPFDLKKLNEQDPVKRLVEKETGRPEYSPMDPPDAYKPPKLDEISYEDLHPFLQQLQDSHGPVTEEVKTLEETVSHIRQQGIDKEVDGKLRAFFAFFDNTLLHHAGTEERAFYPVLRKRLLEKGEHSEGPERVTAADMMRYDHVKMTQEAAVAFNLLALAVRLPDPRSRMLALDAALQQASALAETIRLHIFREAHIVLPLAHRHLNAAELDAIRKDASPEAAPLTAVHKNRNAAATTRP